MKRFLPLAAKFCDNLLGRLSLEEAAIATQILAPEEFIDMPGVIIDDAQRELVTKTQPMTTLETEWARIAGGLKQRQGATKRHVFRNVLATPDGFFTFRSSQNQLSPIDVAKLLRAPIRSYPQGLHSLPSIGAQFFGHWLLDCLPTTQLIRDGEILYMPTPKHWSHAVDYMTLLDIPPAMDGYVFFDQMAFCEDVGKNSHLAARMLRLREKIQKKYQASPRRKVYLKRGSTGARRTIENEDELIAQLLSAGFVIVSVEDEMDKIVDACCNALTIVSIEGSHLAHAFLPATKDTRYLVINPSDQFNNVFADYLGILGGRMGTVVAEATTHGYVVDVPHLIEMIARIHLPDSDILTEPSQPKS